MWLVSHILADRLSYVAVLRLRLVENYTMKIRPCPAIYDLDTKLALLDKGLKHHDISNSLLRRGKLADSATRAAMLAT